MSTDLNPPTKRRRLSTSNDAPSSQDVTKLLQIGTETPSSSPTKRRASPPPPPAAEPDNAPNFDRELLASIVGTSLPESTLKQLEDVSGGNLERAVNMYFDGSWQTARPSNPFGSLLRQGTKRRAASPTSPAKKTADPPRKHYTFPARRYLGVFGVGGWATRSGQHLLHHGEAVTISRDRITSLPQGAKKAVVKNRKTADIVVRFSNSRGQEVGRLPQDVAAWVSTLIDQKIAEFDGTCVYAPERMRTNDTVYLQLKVWLKRDAFERKMPALEDDNRVTDIFAAKETERERAIRLRQVALVKLFEELHLAPSQSTGVARKHGKKALLKLAEDAEKTPGVSTPGAATPTGEDGEEQEDGKELEQDQLDALYKKAQSFDFNSPEAEPAPTFALNLRPYQKQALHWLLNKEKNHSDREDTSMHPLWEEYTWPTHDADNNPTPTVVDGASFYVNPYSGEMSLDFPRQEQNCLGGILADEMGLGKTIEMMSLIHTHRPDRDEMKGKKTVGLETLISTPATLVIAPMSLLAQWESEAEASSVPGTLKTFVYYGSEKKHDLSTVVRTKDPPDVIITSYGTVLSEYTAACKDAGQRRTGLFGLHFYRIILDEAHHIKNRVSKTARACYELHALHRWALSGTPIVNRLEDLFSLVRFLRVDPWQNFSFWKTFITMPFEAKDFLRALDVVQTVLEPLVLRRTKDMRHPNGDPLVPLPPKTIVIEKIRLSAQERAVYDHIADRAKRSFNRSLEQGTLMKSYTSILAQILRLRQCCCHPNLLRRPDALEEEELAEAAYDAAHGLADDMDLNALLDRFAADEAEGEATTSYPAHVLKQLRDAEGGECPFCCSEPMEDMVVTGCYHAACKACLLQYIEHEKTNNKLPLCCVCRAPLNPRDIFALTHPGPRLHRLAALPTSTKITALLSNLRTLHQHTPTAKSVVFSQFTSFLRLLPAALAAHDIPCLLFTGALAHPARRALLHAFRTHPGPVVLLISLRAGGVGLNLTCANNVFMMDPWWSFAVEAQAIDRVHRMGQEREVRVVRFVVEDSVEERMVGRIQERKRFLAGSLGMMGAEERGTRIEDIRDLLND